MAGNSPQSPVLSAAALVPVPREPSHRFGKSTLKVIIVITSRIASSAAVALALPVAVVIAAAAAAAADVRPPKNINSCPGQKLQSTQN